MKWSVEVASDSSAAISICSKSCVGETRHIAARWLWVQDAVCNKQIKLIQGAANVSDVGSEPLEPKRRLELMRQLPLAPPRCRRFLAVLAMFLAAESAEASSAVAKFSGEACTVPEATFEQQLWTYATYVAIVLTTYGIIRFYDRVSGILSHGPRRFVSVASQTQTTYAEVRGAALPRFTVLPERSHG